MRKDTSATIEAPKENVKEPENAKEREMQIYRRRNFKNKGNVGGEREEKSPPDYEDPQAKLQMQMELRGLKIDRGHP